MVFTFPDKNGHTRFQVPVRNGRVTAWALNRLQKTVMWANFYV